MPEYNVDRIRQIMGEINVALRKLSGYKQDIQDYLKIINKAVT